VPKTLVVTARSAGFFSSFNCVMTHLDYHLGRDGFTAVEVDWRGDENLPHFSYGNLQDGNIWQHFFEPLAFPSFPPTRVEMREYPEAACRITYLDVYATLKLNPFWRRRYHELFQKYIGIKPFLELRAAEIYQASMAGRYCIGVHYRHPQHQHELLRPMPPLGFFIARVKRHLPKTGAAAVFLASDFAPAVTAFQSAFGAQLVVVPQVTRAESAMDEQIHHGLQKNLRLGEEVLVDCLLLSRCDVLIHVNSNVATAAAYINPRLKLVYCETALQALIGYVWSINRLIIWQIEKYDLHKPAWWKKSLEFSLRCMRFAKRKIRAVFD
jgi:hypothetical protein